MLKRLLILILFPAFVFAASFPSTRVLDDFNRTDEDPIAGIWTNGVTGTGQCAVSSNTIIGSSGTDDCYITQPFSANQEVFMTMASGSTFTEDVNFYVFACLNGGFGATIDGYGFRFRRVSTGNDVVQMIRMTDATFPAANLGTAYQSVEFADGDKVGMRIQSNGTLTLYFNDGGAGWAQVDQVTGETTYNCNNTNAGIRIQDATVQLDDIGGGNMLPIGMILEAH